MKSFRELFKDSSLSWLRGYRVALNSERSNLQSRLSDVKQRLEDVDKMIEEEETKSFPIKEEQKIPSEVYSRAKIKERT